MKHIVNTETIANAPYSSDKHRSHWSAMLIGVSAAIVVSYLMCRPPYAHTLSLSARIFTSAAYILIACLAGSFGTWIALRRTARRQFFGVVLWGIRCWAFLPSIMIFVREKSIWASLIALLSAILMALYLSRMPDAASYCFSQEPNSYQDVERNIFITQLHFKPISRVTFFASLCLYGAVTSAIAGRTGLLALLLAIGAFLLVSQVIASQSKAQGRACQRRSPYALVVSAFLIAFVALTVPGQMSNASMQPATPMPRPSQTSQRNSSIGYHTIVLWPVPKKEKIITLPTLETGTTLGHKAKPWVILFDGPYWYFKIHGESPGPLARNAHGDPLKVNVRSTNNSPLLMEAHQNLPDPVDLSCCRELQLVFQNDAARGASLVGITLTDSHTKALQSLGIKSIPSNHPEQPSTFPIEETVSFPLPKPGIIKQFDQITVVLLPNYKFTTIGRKVAIEKFIMIPN